MCLDSLLNGIIITIIVAATMTMSVPCHCHCLFLACFVFFSLCLSSVWRREKGTWKNRLLPYELLTFYHAKRVQEIIYFYFPSQLPSLSLLLAMQWRSAPSDRID